jgi:F-type H+-transporting ATPase subunit a
MIHLFGLDIPSFLFSFFLIDIFLLVISLILTHNLKVFNISKKQAFTEWIVEKLLNLVTETMGDKALAIRYTPILGSFFITILVCNYSGLIPGFGIVPGLQSPTSVLTGTVGLAICALVLSIISGIREKGLSYFKHFIQPYAFILPLNILDEIKKPVSLSLRLYGSVYAEEVVIFSVYKIFPAVAPVVFYFISIFFGALQAYIFTLLTTTYFASATAKHA